MNDVNIFEKASKGKLRFTTSQGELSTEELWDLSLVSLDNVAKAVNKKIKESSEESFIGKRKNSNSDNELRLDVLKHIIGVRMKEDEDRKSRIEKKQKLEFLQELKLKKQTATLESMSEEDIDKQIEMLKEEEV